MKLQGGMGGLATLNPDDMMSRQTNGPITQQDFFKNKMAAKHSFTLDPKGRSRSSCEVDLESPTKKQQRQMAEEKRRLAESFKYKLQARDQALMQCRSVQQELEAGIKGYEVKLWHHDTQKPIAFGIHQHQRPHHYLDDLMRMKANVPAPTSYELRQGLEINKNVMN